ncbi:MAG: hypothetical protein AAF501_15805 [Pseudomonadota bacterium]
MTDGDTILMHRPKDLDPFEMNRTGSPASRTATAALAAMIARGRPWRRDHGPVDAWTRCG